MGSKSIDNIPIELFEQNYKAKKSLGQNFMQNEGIIRKVTSHIETLKPASIIEIGPGLGAFTKHFVKAYPTEVIEFDKTLSEYITLRYPEVTIHFGDVLEMNLESIVSDAQKPVHIFGALPYNISKPIIRKVVELSNFSTASFIIQKEVADKYLANAPQSSKLSLNTRLYAKTTKIFDINPASFKPKPKVTSTYISLVANSPVIVGEIDKSELSTIINQVFTSPRKTIGNNLKKHYRNLPSSPILDKRAQALTLDTLVELHQVLHPNENQQDSEL